MPIRLEVDIDGDARGLSTAVKQSTDGINKLSGSINKNLSKSTGRANHEIGGTTATLTSFSQVVQDAPYGIRGVANNIEQLTSQFAALRARAGGTRAAFGILLSSLTGPAGILLAVSATTALMQSLSSSGITLTGIIDKLSGRAKTLADSLQDVANSAAEQIAQQRAEVDVLNSLISIARDENQERQQRQRAIDRINEEYPKLNQNITLENANTKQVTTAINNYTAAMERSARVKAAQSLLSEQYQKVLEAEAKGIEGNIGAWDIFVSSVLSGGSIIGSVTRLGQRGFENQQEAIQKANEAAERYRQILNEIIGEQVQFDPIGPDAENSLNQARQQLEKIREITLSIRNIDPFSTDRLKQQLQQARQEYQQFSEVISGVDDIIAGGRQAPVVEGNFEPITRELNVLESSAANFSDLMSNAIAGIARDFTRTFRSLAAETGATFASVLSGIINTIGVSITDVFVSAFADQMKDVISDLTTATEGFGKATAGILAGVGLLGGLLQNLGRGGQIAGSGLQGAAAGFGVGLAIGGAAGGPIGAAIGGLVGLVGGIFGSNKKQEQLQQQQLDEMRRATAYTQEIIGKFVEGIGVVEGIQLDEMGRLTARVRGKDLEFTLEQAQQAGVRGL